MLKLFGKRRKQPAPQQPQQPEVECVHGVRVPHWDSLEDMGHEERASYFTCESCRRRFTPEEHAAMASATPVSAGDERLAS